MNAVAPNAGTPLRVLGIDPGTIRLGYAVIEFELGGKGMPVLRYLECGVIRAPRGVEVAARLLELTRELALVIDEFTPSICAIEKAFHGKSAHSALTLGQARGALMLLAHQRALETFEYAPAHVKRVVAGHGAADKAAIAERVRLLFGLRTPPASDAADALAIACCHALGR